MERKLTEEEFNRLITEAPDSETRFIKNLKSPYEFFQHFGLEQSGIVNDVRPLYFASLVSHPDGYLRLWTVVNKDVKEQKELYKTSKRRVIKWSKEYGFIYATMSKDSPKNIEWTQRIGFKIVNEDDKFVTLRLGG